MTEEKKSDETKPPKLEVSPAQVAGGALASVTAAFLGSQLGVAGTFLGAGLTSVVITVGGAFYQRSLEATKQKADAAASKAALKRAKKQPWVTGETLASHQEGEAGTRQLSTTGDTSVVVPEARTRQLRPLSNSALAGMHWPGGEQVVDDPATRRHPELARTTQVEQDSPTRKLQVSPLQVSATTRLPQPTEGGTEHIHAPGGSTEVIAPDKSSGSTDSRGKRIKWGVVALTSGLAFVLCMLIVTGFEGVTGRPLSGGQGGTTLGRFVRPAPPAPPEPAPQQDLPDRELPPQPQPEPSSAAQPSSQPTVEPTTGQESQQPSGEPSAPPQETTATEQPTEPQIGPTTTQQQPTGSVLPQPFGG